MHAGQQTIVGRAKESNFSELDSRIQKLKTQKESK